MGPSPVAGLLWRVGGALALAVLGLSMLFWALERSSLVGFEATAAGVDMRPPTHIYVLLFAGLVLLNLSTFYALSKWSRFVRDNPETKQAPVWLLLGIIVIAGALLVTGIAVHSGWVRSQDVVPTEVDQGFIAYEVSFAALILVPLVLLAARWSPGYRHVPVEA